MALVLGLDCSTGWTSMGLSDGKEGLGEFAFPLGRRQSARLPGLLENLLLDSGKKIRDISLIAVTTGPGFFTGIRVGLSYAAGLAYALDKPVAGVPTLFAMAHPYLIRGTTVVPILRARSDGIFAAMYRLCDDTAEIILEGTFLRPSELSAMIDEKTLESTVFVGRDIAAYPELERLSARALALRETPVSGMAVAMIASSGKSGLDSPLTIGARYFRGPDIGRPPDGPVTERPGE